MTYIHPRTNSQTNNPWFAWLDPRKDSLMRLFCFPCAGGTPSMFCNWSNQLPKHIEVVAVRLPGRDMRIKETPFSEWPLLLSAAEQALDPYLDKPFAFFGHSLGARLAYELTRRLQEKKKSLPRQLLIAGCRCPHIPSPKPYMYDLPEQEFHECLQKMSGTPPEVLADRRLMAMLEPTIRADMKLAEVWGGTVKELLNVPIAAFSGLQDDIDPPDKMVEWKRYTSVDFTFHTLSGNHFFIRSSEALLLDLIANICGLAAGA
ncbi:MAG: alpha/beta fold hydrolase [Nostoc sp.]|uniref:thioesterase II family protein n=1 Tax=Nostoc sp. TaxID=1180 RepID=UPI002FFA2637